MNIYSIYRNVQKVQNVQLNVQLCKGNGCANVISVQADFKRIHDSAMMTFQFKSISVLGVGWALGGRVKQGNS